MLKRRCKQPRDLVKPGEMALRCPRQQKRRHGAGAHEEPLTVPPGVGAVTNYGNLHTRSCVHISMYELASTADVLELLYPHT